ncbi:MAG: M23 family metallopeptidase [gamma proteobacterium symbiont of Lucinoma myriamae]|nr:M23 family metallopeptidase [gamma proteobacterium symbiont of Lucinoma myriamae]
MLSFDIQSYLENNAPHLAQYSETISHWSGRSSISPKIIITLIEMNTSLVSTIQWDETVLQDPLGDLSSETGFSEQIRDVASRLSQFYYQNIEQQSPAQLALAHVLVKQDGVVQYESADFSNVYYQLFPQPLIKASEQIADYPSAASVANPPVNLLQFPFPVGESWAAGGTHSDTGGGPPFSSMDFWKVYQNWGENTSNYWVSASTGGRVIKHSSCSVEVIDDSGWSSSYYHLDNVRVTTGQRVTRNTPLANYANNIGQALCNGGGSSGPHIHFSIKNNGEYKDLDGVTLSQHVVHGGRWSYDTHFDYFWIVRPDGSKYYANYTDLYNPGVATVTPPTTSGMILSPLLFLLQ